MARSPQQSCPDLPCCPFQGALLKQMFLKSWKSVHYHPPWGGERTVGSAVLHSHSRVQIPTLPLPPRVTLAGHRPLRVSEPTSVRQKTPPQPQRQGLTRVRHCPLPGNSSEWAQIKAISPKDQAQVQSPPVQPLILTPPVPAVQPQTRDPASLCLAAKGGGRHPDLGGLL